MRYDIERMIDDDYRDARPRRAKEYSSKGFRRFKRVSCSTKRRFPNEERAKAFRSALAMHGRLKNAMRIYPCPICKGYHLTGQVSNENEKDIRRCRIAGAVLPAPVEAPPADGALDALGWCERGAEAQGAALADRCPERGQGVPECVPQEDRK